MAIERGDLSRACAFDASDLRTDGARKLGLGSSAAILVATMAAVDGLPRNTAEWLASVGREGRWPVTHDLALDARWTHPEHLLRA